MPEDIPGRDLPAAGAPERDAAAIEAETFLVDIDGFEGPLDMLLALARTQKVDLRRISVLALADQYLAFVAAAESLRVELAADYLVMASWLAWLKSRLLLPPPHPDDEPSGEEMAAHLTWQLERLEAMRTAAAQLMARDRLGRDVFARGEGGTVEVTRRRVTVATLSDLLTAYARVRTREAYQPLHVDRTEVLTMEDAIGGVRETLAAVPGWLELADLLPSAWRTGAGRRRNALAASFAATLELARTGEAELAQSDTFGPLHIRRAGGT